MILVTVGTQLPFDRLIQIMDELAPTLGQPVFAQIGTSSYRPANVDYSETIDPRDFDQRFRSASVIVAHAGIGTVLTAQRHGKPIILFPRRAALGEHRNDHQLATCAQLKGRPGIYVANDKAELAALLDPGAGLESGPTDRAGVPGLSQLRIKLGDYIRSV